MSDTTYPYVCGSCGIDTKFTIGEMTEHWQSHIPTIGQYVSHTREEVEALLAPYMAVRNAGFWPADGWLDLIVETHKGLVARDPSYRIGQVKEKFGGLRYYIDAPATPEIREWIKSREEESYVICQNCGSRDASVQLRNRGWYATLCNSCDQGVNSERGYHLDY